MLPRTTLVAIAASLLFVSPLISAAPKLDTSRGDRMIVAYFREETAKLRDRCLTNIESLDQWKSQRKIYRRQLFEMLGLDPLPTKTDLKATVTGKVQHEDFTVEKIHFQSLPGLYVTANLYLPNNVKQPAPAILYVCGHSNKGIKDGISYGNKVPYQHHGSWFARHGYVCLTIDTLQLGEIEGLHHGTYNHGMWWWNNRGYTPAGVEAWNCIRALDYLESRKEADGRRIGVTGRSGGGAYSWWIAALDERIKVAVPVAGITDLQNYVVDGCVEGHCDCMFLVNTYRWDYPLVAALVAPRPLLISNSDRDHIFPLDGVVRTYNKVRKIYELYGAREKLGLQITSGPHKDTQELRVHAFRWFDEHLKGHDRLIEKPAVGFFEPEALKVFAELPKDQVNSKIQETFTKAASLPATPASRDQWQQTRDAWRAALLEKSFRGWPEKPSPLDVKQAFSVQRDGIRFSAYDFTSQEHIRLRLYLARRVDLDQADLVVLNALDQDGWNKFLATMRTGFEKELQDETRLQADEKSFQQQQRMYQTSNWAMAYVAPRGIGPTAWKQHDRKQTQIRRRFMLLGQTLDGMRVWDVRRAIQALRSLDEMKEVPLWLQSERQMAGVTLYASLWEPEIARLDLYYPPRTHRGGPALLNVRRYLDMPQAVAMAAERSRVVIYQAKQQGWEFPTTVAEKLGWEKKQFQIRKPPATKAVGSG